MERGGVWEARRFCSRDCYHAYRDKTALRDHRVCPICGDGFIVRHKSHNVITCGKEECRRRYRREVVTPKRVATARRQYASGEREPAGKFERMLQPLLAEHGWVWNLRWFEPDSCFELDLALVERKLNVEVDGDEHRRRKGRERDAIRDEALIDRGWRILRVSNDEVDASPEGVARHILAWAEAQ